MVFVRILNKFAARCLQWWDAWSPSSHFSITAEDFWTVLYLSASDPPQVDVPILPVLCVPDTDSTQIIAMDCCLFLELWSPQLQEKTAIHGYDLFTTMAKLESQAWRIFPSERTLERLLPPSDGKPSLRYPIQGNSLVYCELAILAYPKDFPCLVGQGRKK